MAGRYKAYPEYKSSGVFWLNKIPSNWTVNTVKRLTDFQVGWTPSTGNDNNFVGNNLWANISDLKEKYLHNTAKNISDEAARLASMDITPKGSLLYSFKLSVGSVSFAQQDMYTNEAIASFLSSSKLPLEYLYYSLPIFVIQNASTNIYGARILNQDLIKNAFLLEPPYEEAEHIANFLDHETAKIDTLIAKQEKLIELLKEKRQAVISHAVTKGLNPDAPMRDSGVEWLGEVPKHWEIKKIKHCASLISSKQKIDGQPVIALENIEGLTGDFVATNSNYNGEDVAFLEGDILFGKLRPYLAKVFLCQKSGIAFGDLLTYRPNQKTESSFLFYTMISSWFIEMVDSSTYGAKMPRASSEFVNEMFICFPPLEEQKTIYKELDTILQHFKTLTDKANKAIELMKERKTALISAAVTGKIDVRDFVSEQGQPQGV